MELNFWTGTELERGRYDDSDGRWAATLRRADGTRRELRPRHIVMATGVSGIPNRPDIPGLNNFKGQILHSSQYDDGERWSGKRALVIGTGNSGHDIAQDLHSSSTDVTLVQRSSTLVTNIEPSAQLAAALIVLATGYKPQEYLVQKLLGEEVAARVGPIWGFGDGQELRNMYARTGQPGLWFIAGSLAQCRINSKYLALQVKAIEEGLLPRASPK